MMTYEQMLTFAQKELKGMQTWNRVGMGEKWEDEGIIELLQRILLQSITFATSIWWAEWPVQMCE